MLVAALFITCAALAQPTGSVDAPFYNTYKKQYVITRDTITNAGTALLRSNRVPGSFVTASFQVTCTKVSGTLAGTLTLQGSNDGVNFAAIPTETTQTGLATATVTDTAGAKSYIWWLKGSPFLYYQVSWSGGTTMVGYLDARILAH